ncbi:MAG: alpha/beta hydrolase [Caulobacteraceae bacterium]|nr:alpha/beta hydrolase [Caulobacteraceae bacterium]
MRLGWTLLVLGWVLALGGGWAAHRVQTSGGIEVQDIVFPAADGAPLSGLLYVPPTASAEDRAPAVLLSHGYINTREMQSPFAIELARRGFVVLAMDMSGHGHSAGTVGAYAFGGPAALAQLRALPMVDPQNVGLAGHSLGGAPMLFAAQAAPDGYRAMALVGSTPGILGAPAADGQAFPRNLAVVFGQYDEFPELMWQVPRGGDIVDSPRLKGAFGVTDPVTPGQLYGDPAQGTGRILHVPPITHPWEHFSHTTVGAVADWFQLTLDGEASPRPANDQIWLQKELATLAALIGAVCLMLGTFHLVSRPLGLVATPAAASERRGGRWWAAFAITALVPALTYFPFMRLGALVPVGPFLPQQISNQLLVWALLNALIGLAAGLWLQAGKPIFRTRWIASALASLAAVAMAYGALVLIDALFVVDFRFWVLALKPLQAADFGYGLVYLALWTGFFLLTFRAAAGWLPVKAEGAGRLFLTWPAALSLGFVALLVLEYGALALTGRLLTPQEPLNTIIAIQFAPLLALFGLIGAFTYRRTGGYAAGAFICALFLTWYVVGGTAMHWAG